MKKILKVPIMLFLSVFLLSGMSMATTYTIDDVYNEFPGDWGTGLESSDHNGVPHIDSASITVDGGYIKQIQIIGSEFDNPIFTGINTYWDSLFINTNDGSSIGSVADGVGDEAWDNWDYYVTTNGGLAGYSVPNAGWTYTLALLSNYRDEHPNGLVWDNMSNDLAVGYTLSGSGVTYDFTSGGSSGIAYTDGIIFGYTPFCANEVFLGSIPEPSNMFLLGTGLIGLTVIGRRRFFK
jgi:hypothetical protein